MEDPELVERRLIRRAALRTLHGATRETTRGVLSRLGIDAVEADVSPAMLIERYAADDPDAPETMPVFDAISILMERISHLRAEPDAA